MPIVAHGWQREWLARGLADLQTGLGVSQVESANLNAVLLPIEQISPELRKREQDDQFVEVALANIVAAQESEMAEIRANPDTSKIWICANLHKEQANNAAASRETGICKRLKARFASSSMMVFDSNPFEPVTLFSTAKNRVTRKMPLKL